MAIHFKDVEKRFNAIMALRRATFRIDAGAVTALVGANGAGKTTALRLMIGLTTPDGGEVLVAGLSPVRQGAQVRRQTSYLPDTPFLAPALTGLEHLQFHADVYHQREALQRAQQLAEHYRLADVLKRPTATYSRGMQQKLALIRALMVDTPVLLLDEPFNALDPPAVALLQAQLQERARQGGIVVVSSHILSILQEVAGTVLVLKAGALVYGGSMQAVNWADRLEDWFDPAADDRLAEGEG